MKARILRLFVAAMMAWPMAGLAGSAQAAPVSSAAGPPVFLSVKCTGNSFCLGTGFYLKSKQQIALSEEWNGTAWRIIPNPSGYQSDITCATPTFCLASVAPSGKPAREVRWNGKAWRPFSPQPPEFDLSCLSPTFCVTSGPAPSGADARYWNGKIWQDMPMNSGGCGGADCEYNGVSCGSVSVCTDSGNFCDTSDCDGGEDFFDDIWNGTAWNANPEHGPGIPGDEACAGRSFCMILHPEPPSQAAITRDWKNSWQFSSANLSAACHHLAAGCDQPTHLACGTAHFCMALPAPSPSAALIWNGTKWGIAPLALVSGHRTVLTGLACGGVRNCLAIGTSQSTPRGATRPVVERWNGKNWQVTQPASPPSGR